MTIVVICSVLPLNIYKQMVQDAAFSPIRSIPMLEQWESSGKNILHFLNLLCVFERG